MLAEFVSRVNCICTGSLLSFFLELAHVKVDPISVMIMVTTVSLGRTVHATGEMIFW